MNEIDLKDLSRRVEARVASEEGKKSILEALELVKRASEEFERASRVTWQQMMEPMTI